MTFDLVIWLVGLSYIQVMLEWSRSRVNVHSSNMMKKSHFCAKMISATSSEGFLLLCVFSTTKYN